MKNKQENQHDTPLSLAEMLAYLEDKLSPEATAAMDARLAASPEDATAMEALSRQIDEDGADPAGLQAAEADFLAAIGQIETPQAAPETLGQAETPSSARETQVRPRQVETPQAGSETPPLAPEIPVRPLQIETPQAAPETLDQSENTSPASETLVRPLQKPRGFKPWMAIAAAVLILAIPAVLLWPRAMGGEEAFQAYFEPYENVVTARATGGPTDARIRLGLEAYDAFLYEEAAAKFGERLAEDSTDLYANLYGGISLLAMGDAQAALPHLGYVGNGANALQQPGKWYLALAHLALNDRSLAEKHLDALASGQGKYPNLARKLLEDIR